MSIEGDEVRDLVQCLYGAIDRQDWSTLEAVVSDGWSSRSAAPVRSGGTRGSDNFRSSSWPFPTVVM